MENRITVELVFHGELNMGYSNGWSENYTVIYKKLAKLAEVIGIKREETIVGRCVTQVRYPGICRFLVDSSD